MTDDQRRWFQEHRQVRRALSGSTNGRTTDRTEVLEIRSRYAGGAASGTERGVRHQTGDGFSHRHRKTWQHLTDWGNHHGTFSDKVIAANAFLLSRIALRRVTNHGNCSVGRRDAVRQRRRSILSPSAGRDCRSPQGGR